MLEVRIQNSVTDHVFGTEKVRWYVFEEQVMFSIMVLVDSLYFGFTALLAVFYAKIDKELSTAALSASQNVS